MEVYTIQEVSDIIKIPVETIYKHLRTGKLKGAKLGKHWRITDENLKDYLKDSEIKTK